MEPEREVKRVLKRFYKEAPSSGPDAKKVKFSEVKDNVTHHCPLTSISTKMISSAISEEFPNTKSVKLGKQRHLYLFGMDKVQEQCESSSSSSSISTRSDDPALKAALKRIEELEHQNRLLQNRLHHEQEQQHHSPIPVSTLDSEVSGLLCSDLSVFHGPDTIEHFDGFSVDGVLAEIRSHAPVVLELLNTIGQSHRHDDGTDLARLSQLRVMTSLTSLLKCRSVQVLGIQLLITFMLIARSTNKQVRINHIHVHTHICNTLFKYQGHCCFKSSGSVHFLYHCLEVLEMFDK